MVDCVYVFAHESIKTEVRTANYGSDETYFCAADIGNIVELNVDKVLESVDEEQHLIRFTDTERGCEALVYLSETGMFQLIALSNPAIRHPLEKWMTDVVGKRETT